MERQGWAPMMPHMGETPAHQIVPSPALGIVGFVSCCLLAGVLSSISFIDMRRRIVPDGAVALLAVAWAALALVSVAMDLLPSSALSQGIAGALGIGGFALASALALERVFGRTMFGGGDVKLLAALGLYLGFEKGLVMLLIACILAIFAAVVAAWLDRRQGRVFRFQEGIPFVPALSVATLCVVLCEAVLSGYS